MTERIFQRNYQNIFPMAFSRNKRRNRQRIFQKIIKWQRILKEITECLNKLPKNSKKCQRNLRGIAGEICNGITEQIVMEQPKKKLTWRNSGRKVICQNIINKTPKKMAKKFQMYFWKRILICSVKQIPRNWRPNCKTITEEISKVTVKGILKDNCRRKTQRNFQISNMLPKKLFKWIPEGIPWATPQAILKKIVVNSWGFFYGIYSSQNNCKNASGKLNK